MQYMYSTVYMHKYLFSFGRFTVGILDLPALIAIYSFSHVDSICATYPLVFHFKKLLLAVFFVKIHWRDGHKTCKNENLDLISLKPIVFSKRK